MSNLREELSLYVTRLQGAGYDTPEARQQQRTAVDLLHLLDRHDRDLGTAAPPHLAHEWSVLTAREQAEVMEWIRNGGTA